MRSPMPALEASVCARCLSVGPNAVECRVKLVLSPRSDPVERDVHSVTGHIQPDRLGNGGEEGREGGHEAAAVFRVAEVQALSG